MAIVLTVATGSAQQPAHNMSNGGPYKVLKTARVGGEGNWDYIYADAAGRRLYIPRRGAPPAAAAGAAAPAQRGCGPNSDAPDDLRPRHARAGGTD